MELQNKHPLNEEIQLNNNSSTRHNSQIPQKSISHSSHQELTQEVYELKQKIQTLEQQLQTSKIFMYMVIHDLKHPTESMNNQLSTLLQQLQSHATVLESQQERNHSIQQSIQNFKLSRNERQRAPQNQDSGFSCQLQQQFLQSRPVDSGQIIKPQQMSQQQRSHQSNNQVTDLDCDKVGFNEPKLNKPTNLSRHSPEDNPYRKIREKKTEMLHSQLKEFFESHLSQISYIVDGSRYNLQLIIQFDEQSDSMLQAVSTNIVTSQNQTNQFKDILPKLKMMQKNHNHIEKDHQVLEFIDGLNDKMHIYQDESKNCVIDMTMRVNAVKMLIYNTELMRNLMMDLLDLAQMENSTFKLNQGFFSLFDVVDRAFGVMSHVADKKRVKLELKPTTDQEFAYYSTLYGDQSRYLQILINFLSNSLKFSNQDSKVVVFFNMLESQTLISDQVIKQISQSEIKPRNLEQFQINSHREYLQLKVANQKAGFQIKQRQSQSMVVNLDPRNQIISKQSQLLSNQSNLVEEQKVEFLNLNSLDQEEKQKQQLQEDLLKDGHVQTCYITFELGIQDFGCGIPKEKLDSLFISFNNLEQHRKQNPSGRGLGLSICKMIVESMGGTVKVLSEEGKGSTFSVIFKVMCLPPQSKKKVHEKISLALSCNSKSLDLKLIESDESNKPTILLVNDDPFLLFGYFQQLSKFFYIVTAENGLQAVQIFCSHKKNYFDVVILDINMPIMNGYEACSLINKNIKDQDNDVSTTLLYALTSDCSYETAFLIDQHPFYRKFDKLDDNNEVQTIIIDIKKKNMIKKDSQTEKIKIQNQSLRKRLQDIQEAEFEDEQAQDFQKKIKL